MKNDNSSKSNSIIDGGSFQENTAHHVSSVTTKQQLQHPLEKTPSSTSLSRNSLVQPTIYSYTCRGSLHFDDARPNNSTNSTNHHRDLHLPQCIGIQTNLQRVMDLPPMSKERAVKRFIHETDPYGDEDEEKERVGKLRDSEYGTTEQRERLVQKYGYDPTRTRPIVAYTPQPLSSSSVPFSSRGGYGDDSPSSNISNQNTKTKSLKRHEGVRGGKRNDNKDEEKIEPEEQWSTLSCYGSTEVSVLVLQQTPTYSSNNEDQTNDTKIDSNYSLRADETELAGMSPECTFGITLKEVGTVDGGESLATLRLGPLEISVQNHFDFEEDEEEEDKDKYENKHDVDFASAGVLSQHQQKQRSKRKHPVINNHPEQRHDPSKNDINCKDDENNSEPFETRFLNMMSRTAYSMKSNAEIVYSGASSKDFPSKVVTSGEKVIGHFGKTLQNMDKFAHDLVKMWSPSSFSSSEDDDHDS